MILLRRFNLLVLVLFATSSFSLAAQGADGTWTVKMECRQTSKLDALSWTRDVLIINGNGQFQVSDRRGGETKVVIGIQGRQVTLNARGTRAPSESWEWRLSGAVTGGSQFSIEGPTYSQGNFERNCNGSGSLSRPVASRGASSSRTDVVSASPKSAEQMWIEVTRQMQEISNSGTPSSNLKRSPEPINFPPSQQNSGVDQSQARAKEQPQESARQQAQSRADDLLAAVGVSSREEAIEVQTALKAFGFYRNNIDGVPGPITRSAIINWQRSEGLSPSGRLTPSQIESLKRGPVASQTQVSPLAEVIKSQSFVVPPPAPPAVVDPNAGSRVVSLQKELVNKFTSRLGPIAAQRLMAGNEGDIVLLTNENPRAPHFM